MQSEQRLKVVALANAGATQAAIARELGISPQRVSQHLKRWRQQTRQPKKD